MRLVVLLSFFLYISASVHSQKAESLPIGVQAVVTKGSVTISGKRIDYTTHTGYLDLKNDTGKLIAKMFFTYYRKDGEESTKRPVTFTFNGGPGSSSVWLHLGLVGPKRVVFDDEGNSPQPPYSYINNEYSWLDKTDLVFIDPVSTGYSRPAPGENPKQFHGYVEDINSMGSFIQHFLSRYERWGSAKYLAGESYGTTRAAGLAKYLHDQRVFLNGIILISPILNFGTNDYYVGHDLPRVLYIPSYTAAAWFHKKLAPDLQSDLKKALKESEEFAIGEYATALMKGGWLSESEKQTIAEKLGRLTGISKELYLQSNLRVTENRFWKELRRKDGLIVGRLDVRFTGRDLDDASENVSHDPSFTNINGIFTASMNNYFQKDLNFKEEKLYNIFGNVYPWNYNNVANQFLNVGESLRDAMSKNPHLKVFVGCGYYDFATPYFTAQFDVEHMFLRPEQRKNIQFKFYESGHMYYIHKPSLIQSKKDMDAFYEESGGKY